MSRRRAREMALRILFQVDLGKVPWEAAYAKVLEDEDLSEKAQQFLYNLVQGTIQNLPAIDDLIAKVALDWAVDRMANTDRNILRFAIYELTKCPDIPVSATVNEAVELSKIYGDEESGKFVNGILGKVAKDYPLNKEDKG